MSQPLFVVALCGAVVLGAACGSGAPPAEGVGADGATVDGGGPVEAGETIDAAERAEAGDASADATHGTVVSMVVVPATANFFGSGHATLPAPGGGGEGTPPVLVALPPGTHRTLTFTDVSGMIDLDGAGPYLPESGADGILVSTQPGGRKESYYGIGPLWSDRILFLVGVFLDDSEPMDPGPPPYTVDPTATVVDVGLRSAIFVGDGLNVSLDGVPVAQTFVVPEGATRFFLGFADFAGPGGPVGGYDDNTGKILGTVTITY